MFTTLVFFGFLASALADSTIPVGPNAAVDYKALYRDNLQLQNQLIALKKAVSTKKPSPTPILSALFPNLGIFQSNNDNAPTTYAAPALPMYPGIILQVTETITNLINQVIKRQQEILQIIIGCNCSETTEAPAQTTTTAAPTTTTVAPVFAAKGDFIKPYDQDKVTYVENKTPVVEA